MGTAKPNTWSWFNEQEFAGTAAPTLRFTRNPGLDLYGGPLSVTLEHFFDNDEDEDEDQRTSSPGSAENSGVAGQRPPARLH